MSEKVRTTPKTHRFRSEPIFCNAAMTPRMIRTHCKIDSVSEHMLESAMQSLGLSARADDRVVKLSRAIPNFEGTEAIKSDHVSGVVSYRSLDRIYWT